MIELQGVSKVFETKQGEVRALDDVSWTMPHGSFIALRGHSGSGKSTLLSLVGGLASPTSGKVLVDGVEISAMSPAERAAFRAEKVGFVFQMFHLLPYLSVLDNVLVAAKTVGATEKAATDMLTQFGLAKRLTHKPGELSAGERQRTAMARAMMNNPSLLLADEPTGNLDPANAAEVMKLISDYHQNGGAVLLVTHDDDSASCAEEVIELDQGKFVASTSVK